MESDSTGHRTISMITDKDKLRTVLVTDCGSTTTKALLFEKLNTGWRQTFRGEAPTTVEKPVADVTVGGLNAFSEIQELSGRKILLDDPSVNARPFEIKKSPEDANGIDLYLSTSSAGGGLQMLVGGIVKEMSAESAERAALGAGAIVLEVLSADDRREEHERIERIRHLKPDIVLLTGGVDGGSVSHVIEMAEVLLAAAPKPRFGVTLKLPVIYAGNRDAAAEVERILSKKFQVSIVDNVRPVLEQENLGPARQAIHDFFLSHVMSHSPGYDKLLTWTPIPVMPTPAAVGDMVLSYSKQTGQQVLCADIGGATTDVFSVFRDQAGELAFNRTVSANLGMSYSIGNVLVHAGTSNISRWLNYDISDSQVRDRIRNKMIRPTSIPQTMEDLWLEQAVCREALFLALEHHRSLAVGLSGVRRQRGISEIFSQSRNRQELVDMMKLDLVIGSGGVLSHAPNRLGSALMMLDGFALEGVTEIAVDSIFMMPHLGVFASVNPEAAAEIFLRDCLYRICHSIVPVFPISKKIPTDLIEVEIDHATTITLKRGEVLLHRLPPNQEIYLMIRPLHDLIDVGAGPGNLLERSVVTGEHGLILDGRNRPIELPKKDSARVEFNQQIYRNLELS